MGYIHSDCIFTYNDTIVVTKNAKYIQEKCVKYTRNAIKTRRSVYAGDLQSGQFALIFLSRSWPIKRGGVVIFFIAGARHNSRRSEAERVRQHPRVGYKCKYIKPLANWLVKGCVRDQLFGAAVKTWGRNKNKSATWKPPNTVAFHCRNKPYIKGLISMGIPVKLSTINIA